MDICIANGKILTEIAKNTYKMLNPGVNILDVARATDAAVNDQKKMTLAPTSIEVNDVVNNYAPWADYTIAKNDIVSFTVSLCDPDRKGRVKCAFTRGPMPDLIAGLEEACRAGMKDAGVDVPLMDLRYSISEILQSHGIAAVANVCGHSLEDSRRIIPCTSNIPEELLEHYMLRGQKMKAGETFCIEVYGTDAAFDKSAKPAVPTMFYRTSKRKNMPLKSSRAMLTYIKTKYADNVFALRDLKESPSFIEHAFHKLVKEQMLAPVYSGIIDKGFNVCAHVGHSIYIGESGTTILC